MIDAVMRPLIWGLSTALAQVLPGAAVAACPIAEIVSPEQGTFIAQPRPPIEWRALPGISRYRVQLESRVPEGRVLASIDSVVTGTKFMPPANLTDSRAAVKLQITAECGVDGPSVTEYAAWFFLDLSSLCPPPDEISVSAGTSPALSWKPVKQALRYEVSVFAASEGKLISKVETLEPKFRFSAAPAVLYYVALRARCAEAYSAPVYRVAVPSR